MTISPRLETVTRGILAQIIGRAVTALTSFALLPFVVASVGSERYGLYLLVVSVSGYFTLLDFGVSPTLVKYVAEYRGRGEVVQARRTANAAFTFYVAVGVFAAGGLAMGAMFADRLFGLSPAQTAVARPLLGVSALMALVVWPTAAFRGVAEGFQRYDVTARIEACVQLVRAAAIVAALLLGSGVLTLLLLLNLGTIVTNLICYTFVRRWDPEFRIVFPSLDPDRFRLIFGFAAYVFAGSLASLLIFQFDYLIVGRLLSVSAVTVFGIAASLHMAMKTLDNLLGGPPWAASAELEGQFDHARQQQLFLRGTRYLALLFVPFVEITIVFAGPLVRSWMGAAFEESVAPARILLASWILISLWETGTGILTTRGILRVPLLLVLTQAGLHLGLALALARPLGVTGVALATLLPIVMMWLPVMAYILHCLGVRPVDFLQGALLDALVPVTSAPLLALVVLLAWYPATLLGTLLELLLVYVAIFGLTYALSLRPADRQFLQQVPRLCASLVRRR